MVEKLISFFLKKNKVVIFVLFGVTAVFCIVLLQNFQKNMLESNSIEDAKLYAQAILNFRTLYTDEVVNKIQKKGGFEITHEHMGNPNAIPLPATLSIELGKLISESMSGGEIQLYSAYPFPWRVDTGGGLNDSFKRMAWAQFEKHPEDVFYEFVTEDEINYIRYAVPDRMRASCVECHNTHPSSPKKDWKVGDVRGILEIKRPVNIVSKNVTGYFEQTMFQLFLVVAAFLILIYFLVDFLRGKIVQLDQQAQLIKAQQEKLIYTSKLSAVGEMAGGVAHEINNPLGAISVASQTLRKLHEKNKFDDPRVLKTLTVIDATIERIAKIIKGLRVVSRDSSEEPFTLCTLKEIISDSLSLCSEKFKVHHVDLRVDLEQPDFSKPFMAKRVQLSQVFLNLLVNSYDAIAKLEQKWIEIKISSDANYFYLRYVDSGLGIPKEVQEKMFLPFYTTKEVGKGTGLGLSISKSIIEGHKGSIEIDNSCANTCFLIKLPLTEKG